MGHAFSSRPVIRRPALFVAALVLLTLAGCGRRGPLELPTGAPPTQDEAAAAQAKQTRTLQNRDTPGLIQSPDTYVEETAAAKQQVFQAGPAPRAINAPPVERTGRFPLDPLL